MKNETQIRSHIDELYQDIEKFQKEEEYWRKIENKTDSIIEKTTAKNKKESAQRIVENKLAMMGALSWVLNDDS